MLKPISYKEFTKISSEVTNAVYEIFIVASLCPDYPMFLAANAGVTVSNDADRIMFLAAYRKRKYSFNKFKDGYFKSKPNRVNHLLSNHEKGYKYCIYQEFMIYLHIWESKFYLSSLINLAKLCAGDAYNNNISIPETTRDTFLNTELVEKFNTPNTINIYKILKKCYDPDIRNALAHGECRLSWYGKGKDICFDKSYAKKSIFLGDWAEIFCYSSLLNIVIQNIISIEYKRIFGSHGSRYPSIRKSYHTIDANVFGNIRKEVEEAVEEVFQFAESNQKNPNDYILFLARGQYVEEMKPLNPYVMDYTPDKSNDLGRLEFLIDFLEFVFPLNSFPSFLQGEYLLLLSEQLMLYSQIWESKYFLKTLKKLANLCESLDYDWDIQIPSFNKQNFIRNDIRNNFKNKSLKIAQVITNGFHSQIRNAFSHSDYSIDWNNNQIKLSNHDARKKETIQNISFDDWVKRFCYSVLLNYTIYNKFEEERQKFTHNQTWVVQHKNKNGATVPATIIVQYDGERSNFRFKPL